MEKPPANNPVPIAPSATALPEDWVADSHFLDNRRSIGNLTLPRHVASTTWAKERGIAGLEVKHLHPSMFLYQNWNSHWLRWIAHGKEAYFLVARTKPEMALVGEILTHLRTQNVDIDAAATNLAVQTQTTQAKNIATKALAQHLVAELQNLVPVQTDVESHDRIRELETQLGALQQKLQQKEAGASTAPDPTSSPKTPAPATLSGMPHSPLGSAEPACAKAPAATLGQPLRQLPLSFSPNSQGPAPAAHQAPTPAAPQPECILKPPSDGSSWLVNNLPAKFQDKELRTWVGGLAINDRKKTELEDWISEVEHYINTLDDEDKTLTSKMRRIGVVWGIPLTVISFNKLALARIMAVASFMER